MQKLYSSKILTVFLVCITVHYAEAQPPPGPPANIDRATRDADRFGRKEAEELLTTPHKAPVKEEEVAPLPSEGEKKFFVKKIKLSGCETVEEKEFASFVKKYEARDVSLSELERLCKEIESAYLKKGVISAVFVPPQDIHYGSVVLRVIEAHMGRLEVAKQDYFNSKRLNDYWSIKSGDVLRYDKMSRSIQMMNKNPDREVKAALHAGKVPGTTDVYLTPETKFPIHPTFSYDNDGSASTGAKKTSFGVRHNNFLDHDDMLLSGYTFAQNMKGYYGYHNLPISPNGASLLYGASKSESTPKGDYTPFDMRSTSDRATFGVHQDIFKRDQYLGEIFTEFNAEDRWVYANTGGTINRERFRIVAAGGNMLKRGFGANAVVAARFTQGLSILGATPEGDPYLSRGAQAVFSKGNLSLNTRAALPFNLQQNLRIESQLASAKLNSAEEMGFGGIDSVRGYPSNDYLADNGLLTSLEILSPARFLPKEWRLPYAEKALKDDLTALAFVDYGYGNRRAEEKNHHLVGIGGGMRISFYNQGTLRLEWGYPVGDHPLSQGRASFFHFSINIQDNLPEELERIRKVMEEEDVKKTAWKLLEEEIARTDSPIRTMLLEYRYQAESAKNEERLEDAALCYEKITTITASLCKQAEDYVRASAAHEKELKKLSETAKVYYKEGKIEDAMRMWERVKKEADFRPLLLQV